MAEVHDCFTPTELVLMEDLGFSERGQAWSDELDGAFDTGGRLPVNPDGGLKSFGHPIGASGLRMLYEMLAAAARAGGRAPGARPSAGTDPQPGRPTRRAASRSCRSSVRRSVEPAGLQAEGRSAMWLATLITWPSGSRTKKRRMPHGSSVSG